MSSNKDFVARVCVVTELHESQYLHGRAFQTDVAKVLTSCYEHSKRCGVDLFPSVSYVVNGFGMKEAIITNWVIEDRPQRQKRD